MAQPTDSLGWTPAQKPVETRNPELNLQPEQATLDPDQNNRELLIAWDKWRNDFARAAWAKFNDELAGGDTVLIGPLQIKFGNNPGYNFAQGLSVTYECTIDNHRHITDLHVTSSSGNATLDALVLNSVRAQQGKRLLTFPKGSQRAEVSQTNVLLIGNGRFTDLDYGDVEHVKG